MDDKKFQKTAKPLLSNKIVLRQKIDLTENEMTLTFDSEILEILNNFLTNIVKKQTVENLMQTIQLQ